MDLYRKLSLFSNKQAEKGTIAPLLIVAVLIIGVVVGVNLLGTSQIFKSRASGPGEDSLFMTKNGPRTLKQMKDELVGAQFAGPGQRTVNFIANLTPFDIFKAYMQAGPDPVFACAVNVGDPDNMPTTLQTPQVGQEVRIAIARKLHDKSCNQWWSSPVVTNLTTGDSWGDFTEEASPKHICRNGRDPQLAPGVGHQEYEGAGLWYDPNDWKQSVNDCFFNPTEPGQYRADIVYFRDNYCGPTPLKASCTFNVLPAGAFTVGGTVTNSSGKPMPAVDVVVANDSGQQKSVKTDANGKFSVDDIVTSGKLYAVRVPGAQVQTTTTDHSWISCNNTNTDTPAGNGSYECQLAGTNDCSSMGSDGSIKRCNFTYVADGGLKILPISNFGSVDVSSKMTPTQPVPLVYPTASIFGPNFARVGQSLTFSANISSQTGVDSAHIWISHDNGNSNARLTASDVDGFDASKFNCDNIDSGKCNWYNISSGSDSTLTGVLKLNTAGNYRVIVDVVPGGDNKNQRACSSNPFVIYPESTGGFIFQKCGESLPLSVIK